MDITPIPLLLANRKNYGGPRQAGDIKYLVFHYTANDGDHDTANASYFQNNVVYASAHYFVDDDSITQSVPDLYTAYAVGGDRWADCKATGGGTLYGVVKNANSISIEMCDTQRDGTLQATEATMARAAALGRALMGKYHIPIERVYRHFDVTGKHCPAYLMDSGKWKEFKRRLEEDSGMITQEQFNQMMDVYLAQNRQKPPSGWATNAWDKAQVAGVFDGTAPQNPLTREQTALVLDRLGLLEGNE